LGIQPSQFYDFDHKYIYIKIMHYPMNLGYVERECSMHLRAVNADIRKIAAFRRAF
jgi:hypothetical protein